MIDQHPELVGMATFDPYLKWLGIRDSERPPNHYRLLGLDLFEADRDVIANAADRQMSHVRSFQNGPHGNISQDLLNELARARKALLNQEFKQEYDQKLKSRIAASEPPVIAAVVPPPIKPAPGIQAPPTNAPVIGQTSSPNIQTGKPEVTDNPFGAAGSPAGAGIQTRPPRKKRSVWIDLAGWLGGGLSAVVLSYFIINSSWFPGNDEDPVIAENTDPVVSPIDQPKGPLANSVEDDNSTDNRNNRTDANVDETNSGTDQTERKDELSNPNNNGNPTDSTAKKNPWEVPPNQGKNRELPSEENSLKNVPNGLGFGSETKITPTPSQPERRTTVNESANSDVADPVVDVAQPEIVKLAEPARADILQFRRQLREFYSAGYDKSASALQKKKLAETLLEDALETDDVSMKFTMLDQSAEVACSIGDGETAVNALQAMDERFEIDFWKRADNAMTDAKSKAKLAPQFIAISKGLDSLIERALASDRYEEAASFATTGSVLSKKFRDSVRFNRYNEIKDELKDVRNISRKGIDAVAKLEANPDDPEANLDRGDFLFFVKDDLSGAVDHWLKSSSPEKKMLAKQEQSLDVNQSEQLISLADVWADLGKKRKSFSDIKFNSRATTLYEWSQIGLKGLMKHKAERAAEELRAYLGDNAPAPSKPGVNPVGRVNADQSFISKGLVVHYSLNEEDPLVNISGKGSDNAVVEARMYGNGARAVEGKIGKGLLLDGKTFVMTQNASLGEFEFDESFSAGAFVNISNVSARHGILSKVDTSTKAQGWDISVFEGRVYANLTNSWAENNGIRVNTSPKVNMNAWHHVMFTYDGSGRGEGITIYVDGVKQDVQITHDSLNGSIKTRRPLLIGRRDSRGLLIGGVDEARVYSRKLSAAEVLNISRMTKAAGNASSRPASAGSQTASTANPNASGTDEEENNSPFDPSVPVNFNHWYRFQSKTGNASNRVRFIDNQSAIVEDANGERSTLPVSTDNFPFVDIGTKGETVTYRFVAIVGKPRLERVGGSFEMRDASGQVIGKQSVTSETYSYVAGN